ncbi:MULTISPECIES: ArsR family transcriptional regulator [unclassified Pseudovibrio]|uniref:ArsR/SmtB family transcription factor n=1 Tax=unclassified Pseudovibrio TaxID=2627060 RepID=UPI000709E6B5|nr:MULTISPECIES: ArsR family transcriptional regulator [unclassified Pseudovibrio]KZK92444.1 Helix-turn-helix domain protein [Pseudovibrio sp. W74]KZL03570.1 Helix-turn-helix domain protein [Pseudovibrio sp. Ad14]
MTAEPRLDIIGAALADASRTRILCEMMDGRAFTNKELACAAEISAQTASVHLKQLQAAGLTSCIRSGRCIYHRIASEDVAGVLEVLAGLSPTDHLYRARNRKLPEANIMRARSCYNHIAGRLGVLITNRLVALGLLRIQGEVAVLSVAGEAFFRKLEVDVPNQSTSQKPAVKLCLDWTERRQHISGPLATALMEKALKINWLERRTGSRELSITALGYEIFERDFGIPRDLINRTDYP